MSASLSYLERSKLHSNPTAKAFLELMERKKSNLSVAADLNKKAALIELADKVGPYICLLKVLSSHSRAISRKGVYWGVHSRGCL
jgi:orotidine-5'-phosphate decarboxylase